jgi:hypothetical protein
MINGKEVSNKDCVQIEKDVDNNRYCLNISKANSSIHAGEVTVKASNTFGSIQQETILKIFGNWIFKFNCFIFAVLWLKILLKIFFFTLEPPVFTKNLPAKIESKIEYPVSLEVQLKIITFPPASITWLKNSEIIESSSFPEYTIISNEFSSKISFISRLELDGSTLSVKATNESGEACSDCKIFILCKFLQRLFYCY